MNSIKDDILIPGSIVGLVLAPLIVFISYWLVVVLILVQFAILTSSGGGGRPTNELKIVGILLTGATVAEILIILFIIIILFGAKRLPDLARGLGGSIKSFKQGLKGDEEQNDKK